MAMAAGAEAESAPGTGSKGEGAGQHAGRPLTPSPGAGGGEARAATRGAAPSEARVAEWARPAGARRRPAPAPFGGRAAAGQSRAFIEIREPCIISAPAVRH